MAQVNPIEVLMAEHRLIERVLTAMEACAKRVEAGEAVEPAELGRFARFLRGYADALHHGKEEEILFEEMIAAGFPREAGPIAVMLTDHDHGRALVRAMLALSEKAAWDAADRRTVVDSALGFSGMLRGHIHKEDRILYPMAEQHLPAPAMEGVAERFGAKLAETAQAERELEALGVELERRWSPGAPSEVAAGEHACSVCGGH